MSNDQNQLAKIKAGNRGVQLATVDDMRETAGILCQSGLLPDGYGTAAQVFVGLQAGAEMGLKPMQALNSIAVIHGRPTLWGDSALAMVRSSGFLEAFEEYFEMDDKPVAAKDLMYSNLADVPDKLIAVCISKRVGMKASTHYFSVADAKLADLWNKAGTWRTHFKRMMKYKARAFNLRDNYSDVTYGMHLQEEMVGEVEEPMEPPKCAIPGRHDRRKKVESEQSPPPKDPAESAIPVGSVGGVDETTQRYIDEESDMPPQPETIEAEVVKEGNSFDELLEAYDAAGGTDFTGWAAEALCRDEDEVDEIEKFDADMIGRLERHLAKDGV